MSNEIDFVPFATGAEANVEDIADYQADPATTGGYVNGVANPQNVSRALRQGTFWAAVLANLVSQVLDIPVLDDGNISEQVTNLLAILGIPAPDRMAPTQTSSFDVSTEYDVYPVDATEAFAGIVISIPQGSTLATQKRWRFIRIDAGQGINGNIVTLALSGSDVLLGQQPPYTIANQGDSPAIENINGGAQWFLV